jgi:hypothetical protein
MNKLNFQFSHGDSPFLPTLVLYFSPIKFRVDNIDVDLKFGIRGPCHLRYERVNFKSRGRDP